MSERINSFQDLKVYQEACALDFAIHEATKTFPREELYSLTDQVRRSSRSIGANIAEAWAKRRYPAHFVSKLTDSDGELQETRHWLGRALAYGYLTDESHKELEKCCDKIGGKLGKMIQNPESFT
ncbi:MAG: four helix bundle protein [Opitutaceae bacterium]|nr:four helix bundle protein [Opitutaceae bacterium]